MNTVISVDKLDKSFKVGSQTVPVLKDISFSVKDEDFVIIFGPSGCGKSTLLHSLLGLEKPSKGKILFFDNNLYQNANEDEIATLRKQLIGMVFQQPNWIKALNVQENVAFPLMLLGMEKPVALEKAKRLLEEVGMAQSIDQIPTELSGGQQQRVSLARALINNPEVIIADEPTGNLDYDSGQEMMRLFKDLNKKQNKTIIMVTHDLEYLRFAKTIIQMLDGKILGIYNQKQRSQLLKKLGFKYQFFKEAK